LYDEEGGVAAGTRRTTNNPPRSRKGATWFHASIYLSIYQTYAALLITSLSPRAGRRQGRGRRWGGGRARTRACVCVRACRIRRGFCSSFFSHLLLLCRRRDRCLRSTNSIGGEERTEWRQLGPSRRREQVTGRGEETQARKKPAGLSLLAAAPTTYSWCVCSQRSSSIIWHCHWRTHLAYMHGYLLIFPTCWPLSTSPLQQQL
jgi:hypothetical protein